jgi:hypothetical protein
MKQPQRVYSTPESRNQWPNIEAQWQAMIRAHHARVLKDGENPSDFPTEPVAFETLNFGWVLSAPDIHGKRHTLEQF